MSKESNKPESVPERKSSNRVSLGEPLRITTSPKPKKYSHHLLWRPLQPFDQQVNQPISLREFQHVPNRQELFERGSLMSEWYVLQTFSQLCDLAEISNCIRHISTAVIGLTSPLNIFSTRPQPSFFTPYLTITRLRPSLPWIKIFGFSGPDAATSIRIPHFKRRADFVSIESP